MAWTLAEFSKIETDPLRKSVIDGLIMESNLLELVPFETIGGLSTSIVRYQDLPSVGFRKVNEAYAESTGHFEGKTEVLSLCGQYIDTDKAIARAKNTIADARAIQQTMSLKAMAYSFNDKFINGNPATDPEEYKGVKARIADVVNEGHAGQLIDCAGTAGDGFLLSTAETNNFIDKLDALIYSIAGHAPTYLLMSSKCLLAVRSALRRNQLLAQDRDSFGRIIDMYGSARLIDVGTKADQVTNIITNTETTAGAAGGTECTSIYAIKFGVGDMLWGIQEYPLEVTDLGELQTKPVYRTEIDWPLGLAHTDFRCMGRLYNIIPDAST